MPKGYWIGVGINDYGDPGMNLAGCVNDCEDMGRLAESQGFETLAKLLDGAATAANIMGAIREAAGKVMPGDHLLFTESSHGTNIRDQNGDEGDGYDEAIVARDMLIRDDTMRGAFARFRDGVKITALTDCCNSGTNLRLMLDRSGLEYEEADVLMARIHEAKVGEQLPADRAMMMSRVRALDPAQRDRMVREGAVYGGPEAPPPVTKRRAALAYGPMICHVAACLDNETAGDGSRNGLFTWAVKETIAKGGLRLPYPAFVDAVKERCRPDQTPRLNRYGRGVEAFARTPFLSF